MECMKNEATTPTIEEKETGKILKALKAEPREEIGRAISDGFGEYRRQIAAIRARHGRQTRRSIHAAN